MIHGRRVRHEVTVTLRIDAGARHPEPVRGDLESRYGRESFSGWLELLGHLEALVDRARSDRSAAIGRGDPPAN